MNTLDYGFFFQQLKSGVCVDETCFSFADDPKEDDHYLGFLPQYEEPYWVGYCDIPNGSEFRTAEELLEAKIFDGKSIKERWASIRFFAIGGIPFDEWIKYYGNDKRF